MMVAGIGWLSERAWGSNRRAEQMTFEDPVFLYKQLEEEGYFTVPFSKIRWWNTASQRSCLVAAITLRDVFEVPSDLRGSCPEVGLLSLSRDGALKSNLDYFTDYIQSGRKLARGNLFVHTLPTSPMAEAAITFGFKGPVFHLSAADPKLNLLFDRCEAQGRRSTELNLLCFVADENGVICFFLKPDHEKKENDLFSLDELKAKIGVLWNLKDIFKSLKIDTEITSGSLDAK